MSRATKQLKLDKEVKLKAKALRHFKVIPILKNDPAKFYESLDLYGDKSIIHLKTSGSPQCSVFLCIAYKFIWTKLPEHKNMNKKYKQKI